ncbi:hypothetical protein EVA_04920 [gut metagenome]|uniref:Uncharacterized protein n=1 Tax=gut metagenome TaxID=749906 RepID=J9GHK2_9ZZZZ
MLGWFPTKAGIIILVEFATFPISTLQSLQRRNSSCRCAVFFIVVVERVNRTITHRIGHNGSAGIGIIGIASTA